MDRVKTPPTRRNARQRAHDRLDELFDLAEREQLWGNVNPDIIIQNGRIVKMDFAAKLGEKFDN